MNFEEIAIHLDTSIGYYQTVNPDDVFRVVSGTVFIYIAPLVKGSPANYKFFCEVGQGESIPSFSYRDSQFRQYNFYLRPKDEEADLVCLQGMLTSVLKRNFLKNHELTGYEDEGYEGCLISFYEREVAKAEIRILRDENAEKEQGKNAGKVITTALKEDDLGIIGDLPQYRVVAAACRAAKISVVDYDKLIANYGEEVTLQHIAEASNFAYRNIVLEEKWYEKDCGVLIGNIDGKPVACIPRKHNRYELYYGETEKRVDLNRKLAETVDPHVFSICRTLPPAALKKKDFFRFAMKSVRSEDMIRLLLLTLIGALIGILIPTLNQKIYDEYIPLGGYTQLIQFCTVIATFMVGNLFFNMVKKLSQDRISSRVGYDLQNAFYHRIFRLPESFMRKYESADMAQRLVSVRPYMDAYVDMLLLSGLGALFSLFYLYKMFRYAKKLAWMALLMLVVYMAIVAFAAVRTMRYQRTIGEKKGEASAELYQYLNGIEKIRLAGAEERAAFRYLLPFTAIESAQLKMSRHTAFISVMSGIASTLFSMVFYYIIVKQKVELSTGNFMAFNAAFGSFSAAFLELIQSILNVYQMKPIYERFAPVIETAEEDMETSEVPGVLNGEISLKHVTFSYAKNSPVILNGIDLEIKKGEYIGIVGASGCGKSTLLKLLLGFETPTDGAVCYDGKNLRSLDKRRLRKNLGVVLQGGQLISGSIFENITITAPQATMKQVNEVVAAVGLKHDIEQMPMGLQTVLSENSGTISGGQKQRILIARAIINNPAVLIFDEATSALDNITQAVVSESLDKMHSTRIVVAHRLSTIKNCDRIIVLNNGKIEEEGNYESLMSRHGLFYQLAKRQVVD